MGWHQLVIFVKTMGDYVLLYRHLRGRGDGPREKGYAGSDLRPNTVGDFFTLLNELSRNLGIAKS